MAGSAPTRPAGDDPGRFSYDVAADRWEWDDAVFRIHGYRPGEIEPTTALIRRHKHRGDRERVEAALRAALSTGEAFTIAFRLYARDGLRHVIMVGEAVRVGEQVGLLEGYYLDLTEEFASESKAAADAAVAASAEARETIEQAKGVLMAGYGLAPDAAFAMLRWWSRNRNVKVRVLAERLVALASDGALTGRGLRGVLDTVIDDLAVTPTPAAPPAVPGSPGAEPVPAVSASGAGGAGGSEDAGADDQEDR